MDVFFRLCVDEAGEKLKGRAYFAVTDSVIDFTDLAMLIVQIDKICDETGFPQSFQEKRNFGTGPLKDSNRYKGIPFDKGSRDELAQKEGKVATFDVVLRSRRNTSWQGTVYQSLHKKIGDFECELDFLQIINNELVKLPC